MATRSVNSSRLFDYRVKQTIPYELDQLPPLPDVIEDDSDASWALWREATKGPGERESDTQPMDLTAE